MRSSAQQLKKRSGVEPAAAAARQNSLRQAAAAPARGLAPAQRLRRRLEWAPYQAVQHVGVIGGALLGALLGRGAAWSARGGNRPLTLRTARQHADAAQVQLAWY